MPRTTKFGVSPSDLDDDRLEKELLSLYRTREDTFFSGSPAALRAHTDRMLEIEHEYARRFPDRTAVSPARTRRGARSLAGQPRGRSARTARAALPRTRTRGRAAASRPRGR